MDTTTKAKATFHPHPRQDQGSRIQREQLSHAQALRLVGGIR